jgi:preprotein translocase subunit SecE
MSLRVKIIFMPDIQFTLPDFSGGPVTFLKQTKEELKKVIWPTRPELFKLTLTVIFVSLIVGAYIGLLDYGLTKATEIVIGK